MEHQLDRREFLKKLVGVGALYTTGAAGLLLPKDVVQQPVWLILVTRPYNQLQTGRYGRKHEIRFFSNKMDMILMPTAMPVG